MVTVEIGPGEAVKVVLRDTDGEFVVDYGGDAITVETDMPDSTGRGGVIYREEFGETSLDVKPNGARRIEESEEEIPSPCNAHVRSNPEGRKNMATHCILHAGHEGLLPDVLRPADRRAHFGRVGGDGAVVRQP